MNVLAHGANDRHVALAVDVGKAAQTVDQAVDPASVVDVVTTSTGVLNRSKTSNTRRRNPCTMNMRVEVMSMTVTSCLQAIAVSWPLAPCGSAVIRVPGFSGWREFRMLTGMSQSGAS